MSQGQAAAGGDGTGCEETVQGVLSDHGEQEVLLVERGGVPLCRVRGTTREERIRLGRIGELLGALSSQGVRAAPGVVGADGSGLLLERTLPLRTGGGRRRATARQATPPTAERRALVAAREDLDALIDALHARGWVAGLPPGGGIGTRADGTVVLADLRGLRTGEDPHRRLEDQHWVDSVLEDQGRTLRRRIDSRPDAAAVQVTLPPPPAIAPLAEDPASTGPPAGPPAELRPAELAVPPIAQRSGGGPGTTADAHAADEDEGGILGPESTDRRHRAQRRGVRQRRWPTGARSGARRRPPRPLRRALPSRRALVLIAGAGALVLAGGAAAAALVVGTAEQPPTAAPRGEAASSAPADSSSVSPPAAGGADLGEDPQVLAQGLADARHAYITAGAEMSAAQDGSPAAAQDDALRSDYEDVEVSGEGPVVTDAHVESVDEEQGTALLRARIDQGELRLTMPDGVVEVRPARDGQEVLLELVRGGDRWEVRAVSTP
jgi:hypothetical protein